MNALVCLCCLFSMLAVALILTWGEPKQEPRSTEPVVREAPKGPEDTLLWTQLHGVPLP